MWFVMIVIRAPKSGGALSPWSSGGTREASKTLQPQPRKKKRGPQSFKPYHSDSESLSDDPEIFASKVKLVANLLVYSGRLLSANTPLCPHFLHSAKTSLCPRGAPLCQHCAKTSLWKPSLCQHATLQKLHPAKHSPCQTLTLPNLHSVKHSLCRNATVPTFPSPIFKYELCGNSDVLAVWRFGRVKVWQSEGLAEWRFGRVAFWLSSVLAVAIPLGRMKFPSPIFANPMVKNEF
jgi:hypothetical protein